MLILFLIRGHSSKEFIADEKAQRDTWAVDLPGKMICRWVHADPNSEQVTEEERRVNVPIEDNRANILKKTISALRYLMNHYNPDLIIITNTSSYFDFKALTRYAKTFLSEGKDFSGIFLNWKWGNTKSIVNGDTFVSGAGIYLSRKAATSLQHMDPLSYDDVADDAAITHYLVTLGMRPYSAPRNNLYSSHIFLPKFHIRAKGLVDREQTRSRMLLIHNFFQKSNVMGKLFAYLKIMRSEIRYLNTLTPRKTLRFIKREVGRVLSGKG